MIWNFAAAGLLIWFSRRFENRLRPGSILFGWLVLAGIGRAILETWRPDQPMVDAIGISTSRLVSLLMALAGLLLLLARYEIIPWWKTALGKPGPS
jgi:prolipoprotein diacylglyceryltransferase